MLQEIEQNNGLAVARRGPKAGKGRGVKVTVELGSGRSVVVSAPQLSSLDGLIEQLEDVLSKARHARNKLRIGLNTFIAMLRDQAAGGGG